MPKCKNCDGYGEVEKCNLCEKETNECDCKTLDTYLGTCNCCGGSGLQEKHIEHDEY